MKRVELEINAGETEGWKQTSLESFFDFGAEELGQTVRILIEHRELLRDEELDRLKRESSELAKRIRDLDQRKLKEELECFRDVLALHKRLIKNGGSRR